MPGSFINVPENKPDLSSVSYFVSYASTSAHSFIIITKQVLVDRVFHNIIIASAGLYGEHERYLHSIFSIGAVSENGRIRSEHWLLNSGDDFFRGYIGVKSFPITQAQALILLDTIKQESEINRKESPSGRKTHKPHKDDIYLSALEFKHRLWFRYSLNNNLCGGPRFNGRDYNCKKYALYLLRKVDIRDPELEKDRYPNDSGSGLKFATFVDEGWSSTEAMNIHAIPAQSEIVHPKIYEKIFSAHVDPVQGALALLGDYANNEIKDYFLHPKRHYRAVVLECLNYINEHSSEFTSISQVNSYVKGKLHAYIDPTGTMQKRLDFLAIKANNIEIGFKHCPIV